MSLTWLASALDVRGAGDDPQLVAQPLHGRPGDGDRALQGVDGLGVTELVAERGQQPGLRADDLLPVLSIMKLPVP